MRMTGRAGTLTHDYKRHGTTTLFAAMNVLDGTVIGRNMQRHRHQEFIRFLNAVEREVPAGKTVHHKHPEVRKWLARHPRWTFHFTPTSASWLNAVEGFFATLSKRRLKRGVFRSVVDLQAAINRFLDDHNAQSKPFQWIADPDKIIAAVRRGHQALDSIHKPNSCRSKSTAGRSARHLKSKQPYWRGPTTSSQLGAATWPQLTFCKTGNQRQQRGGFRAALFL